MAIPGGILGYEYHDENGLNKSILEPLWSPEDFNAAEFFLYLSKNSAPLSSRVVRSYWKRRRMDSTDVFKHPMVVRFLPNSFKQKATAD